MGTAVPYGATPYPPHSGNTASSTTGHVPGRMMSISEMSPAHDTGSVESQPLFDFGLAEELLTTGGAGFGGVQVSRRLCVPLVVPRDHHGYRRRD